MWCCPISSRTTLYFCSVVSHKYFQSTRFFISHWVLSDWLLLCPWISTYIFSIIIRIWIFLDGPFIMGDGIRILYLPRKYQQNCLLTQDPEAIATSFSLPISWMSFLIHLIQDVTSVNLLQTIPPSYQPLLRVIFLFIQPSLTTIFTQIHFQYWVCLSWTHWSRCWKWALPCLCSAKPWHTGTHDGQEPCFLLTGLPNDGSTQSVGDPWGHFQGHSDLVIPKKRAETRP